MGINPSAYTSSYIIIIILYTRYRFGCLTWGDECRCSMHNARRTGTLCACVYQTTHKRCCLLKLKYYVSNIQYLQQYIYNTVYENYVQSTRVNKYTVSTHRFDVLFFVRSITSTTLVRVDIILWIFAQRIYRNHWINLRVELVINIETKSCPNFY